MAKKLDFYKYVVDATDNRKFITGVHYKDGYAEATNGVVCIKIKTDYSEKWEDKIVSKELAYIDGQFPNIERVIPGMSDMIEITDLLPNDVLVKEFKGIKPLVSIHKKIGQFESFSYTLPNHSRILFNVWEKVIHFMECYPDAKLYCHKEDTPYRKVSENSLMLVSGDNLMVFMPAYESETEHLGYYWKFEPYLFEKHDELNFGSILFRTGSKGILERCTNGNLTDKDKDLIANVYRYFVLVGYDYKSEVA